MTFDEALEHARQTNIIEKATTLVAFSSGLFVSDGDLLKLNVQAQSEGVDFFLLKGELPQDTKKNGTSRTEVQ